MLASSELLSGSSLPFIPLPTLHTGSDPLKHPRMWSLPPFSHSTLLESEDKRP